MRRRWHPSLVSRGPLSPKRMIVRPWLANIFSFEVWVSEVEGFRMKLSANYFFSLRLVGE